MTGFSKNVGGGKPSVKGKDKSPEFFVILGSLQVEVKVLDKTLKGDDIVVWSSSPESDIQRATMRGKFQNSFLCQLVEFPILPLDSIF
ncbi:hypothetical protein MarSH_385 [Marseillevirus Shanghai 1]|nr:hypothetical protein MarSH_385 [Marseillevirus Shanghai 1]